MNLVAIDCETTGLDPATDRIIDIAVVTATETFHSLVNPGRPVDATFIHGITDADVADAPTLSELVPTLVSLLAGNAIVGHNIAFDLAFLNAEFERANYRFAIPREVGICTMNQSRIYLPDGSHSLGACLERGGLARDVAHRALTDALAAHSLLGLYVAAEERGERVVDEATDRHGNPVFPAEWNRATRAASSIVWPQVR